jgi:enoyl-CoA hydratase/carnithine racemase
MTELVRYNVDAGVATITFNRPEKLNAINWPMIQDLDAAWARAQADDDVRCVIVTGAGKAYCAGDDIKEAWSGDAFDALMQRFADRPDEPEFPLQFDFDKPVIAAINGYCFAGALELSLWFDILLASEDAVFAANFVEHGLMGGATTFWRLPRLVGHSSAALLLVAGERIDAQEALRMGLVSRVLPRSELLSEARRIAARIASFDAGAVRRTRQGLRIAMGATVEGQRDTITYANRTLADLFAGRG